MFMSHFLPEALNLLLLLYEESEIAYSQRTTELFTLYHKSVRFIFNNVFPVFNAPLLLEILTFKLY